MGGPAIESVLSSRARVDWGARGRAVVLTAVVALLLTPTAVAALTAALDQPKQKAARQKGEKGLHNDFLTVVHANPSALLPKISTLLALEPDVLTVAETRLHIGVSERGTGGTRHLCAGCVRQTGGAGWTNGGCGHLIAMEWDSGRSGYFLSPWDANRRGPH